MKRKIRLQGKILIALAIVLCLAGTTVGVMALTSSGSGVTVDNFVGKDKKVVETWRKKNDVSKDQIAYAYAYDDSKDKDIVLKQSIASGKTLKSDETLKVTVSKGADPNKEFELPDFTDKEEKEIKKWFTDNKFTNVTYTYEINPKVENGKFISMDHETGTKVKRSEPITVTICTPLDAEQVEVPDLSGISKADLDNWASTNRINISYIERASDTVEKGGILSISVNKGDRLNAGDTITVEISSGPAENEEDREKADYKPADNGTVEAPSNVSGGEQSGGSIDNSNNDNSNNSSNVEETTYYQFNYDIREKLALQGNVSLDTIKSTIIGIATRNNIPNPGSINFVPGSGVNPGVEDLTPSGTSVTDGSQITCIYNIAD